MKNDKKLNYKSLNRGSIPKRVFFMMVLVSIIPIIILGFRSISQFAKSSNSEFEKNSTTLTKAIEQNVETKFNNIYTMINYIVDRSTFDDGETTKEDLEWDFQLLKEGNPDVEFAYYYDEKNKDFIMYPHENMSNDDYTTREWYKEAKAANGQFILTDVYQDIISKNHVVTIAKAIIENGVFNGVICVDFNLESFADAIAKISYGENGLLSVVDPNGVVIAHTNKEIIGSSNITKNDAWSRISSEKNGIMNLYLNDTNYVASFSTSEVTGWKIILQSPKAEIDKLKNTYTLTLIMTAIILLIIVVILGFMFAKKLSGNINKLKNGIKKIANGDFTENINISSSDELEELSVDLNYMQNNISSLIKNVNTSVHGVNNTSSGLVNMSEEVSLAISQVANTIGEISNGSMESAENLQSLSENLDGVSNEINVINDAVKNISKLATDTDGLSKEGLDMIQEIMDKSSQTKESTLDVSNVVKVVSESVQSIALMNEAIAKITEQTNLLALNAAIEAARAGEAGKGFAVVADEIRKLAEQTSESAKEIDSIIKEVATNVNKAVNEVDRTNDAVNSQEKSVLNAESIFNNIISSINNLTNRVEEIAEGINEVALKKDNVVNQVQNLSAIGEETAASSQEVSASAEEVSASTDEFVKYAGELKELSNNLNDEIQQFKLK
ncbi:methyl-accepting chemotaxis protein [Clostridium botulinum]|uniref:methyl-accepting chemotaxis protein n=1 Tax=Clostridium botulinum TaxID=1491 RepID=UPI000363F0D8|nr:methyl-accepting chemotaxis protein [Clostridium botulinum]MBN1036610.1 methyl-accepting chemotaxis protein [Clostridium botulinum]MBN1078815.1 methyl-accepting chemotaxis protein [Clostridium botulinum]